MNPRPKVLMVHNYYQQRGGESEQAEHDLQLLRTHGHEVLPYTRHNDEIISYSPFQKFLLFFEPTWSSKSEHEIKRRLQEFKPDLVHVQNFFPLISPAVFYACANRKIPVVYSLHNYRLLCPDSFLYRNGGVCEECVEHSLWRGVCHGCYHQSRPGTASVALMLALHKRLNTWSEKVDLFLALSAFSMQKFIASGIPASKIRLRPNYLIEDPGFGEVEREFAIFVGRLSPEKGLLTLVEAWRQFPGVPLKIIGEGPMRARLVEEIQRNHLDHVELTGFMPLKEVYHLLRRSLFLVMPSQWYETFGRTIIEAYACGTPVIASRIGAVRELVEGKRSGLQFSPGDVNDLATQVRYALDHPAERREWSQNARAEYERQFTAECGYQSLIRIYEQVCGGG